MLFAGISSWGRKVGRRLELLTINDRLQITKTIEIIIIAVIHRPQLLHHHYYPCCHIIISNQPSVRR